MYCQKCGKENQGGAEFCVSCGNRMNRGSVNQTTPQSVPQQKTTGQIVATVIGVILGILLVIIGLFQLL